MLPLVVDSIFRKSMDSLSLSFDKVVQDALNKYNVLVQAGDKSELSHIYISFLQSSVLCKLPWLRIDLYDENGRADVVECYSDWDVSDIAKNLYDNVAIASKQSGKTSEYEIEQAWLIESESYYQAFKTYLPQIIEKSGLSKTLTCQWHFGEYLGDTMIVWENMANEIF